MERGAEVRWIVLGPDGRHVTLGRHREPSEDETRRAKAALRAASTSGWLAVARGGPGLGARLPELLLVRPLAGAPHAAWAAAVAAFRRAWKAAAGSRTPRDGDPA